MSRSRKKHPISKDPTKRWMRPIANRRTRRAVKEGIEAGVELLEELPMARELTNDYDICDFIYTRARSGCEQYQIHMK